MATLAEAFDMAVQLHRAGNLQQAEAIYRQILAHDPRNAVTLHLLGVLAMQMQQPAAAIDCVERAIAADPQQAPFYVTLGDILRTTGRLSEAKTRFEQALTLDGSQVAAHYSLGLLYQAEQNSSAAIASFTKAVQLLPRLAEAHNELGNLYRQRGQHAEALKHFEQAIVSRPNYADAHNDMGNLLQDLGRLDEAIAAFERALQLQSDQPATHYNLGNALRAAGRKQQALASYREALRLDPKLELAHNNLGTLLQELDDQAGAEQAFAEAVRLNPNFADAHYNLGCQFQLKRDVLAARASFLRAVALDPHHAPSHFNLGSTYQSERRWQQARECYHEALRLSPGYSQTHCNLGIMAMNEGRYDEAQRHFDASIVSAPDCPEAHCNRGMLRLGAGDFDAGWPEYLWYSRCVSYPGLNYPQPIWDGSPLEGRTIRIVCDHGLGDTIQFVRYLPWLVEQGAGRILLAAQPALHPLLAESGFGELISPQDEAIAFDTHISIMMLPALHYAQRQSLGESRPYLCAQPALVEHWRKRLSEFGGFKIGICWHGNRTFPWNSWRSVPLAEFAPLATVPGAQLVVLQYGEGRDQLTNSKPNFPLIDLGEDVDRSGGAFTDTAAIIANLDLVVTSDTSLAHVAGALGGPVWLAVSAAPEWRWQRRGSSTPWYDQMRLFRQRVLEDWSDVFQQMASQLTSRLVSSGGQATASSS